MVVRNAVSAEQLTECLGAQKVTFELILKVELPVKADRARYVGLAVESWVLVDLNDPDRVVVKVLLDPRSRDEHLLRIFRDGLPPASP